MKEIEIHSTAELPTRYSGQKGWLMKQFVVHPDFFLVLTLDGMTNVFHESMLIGL